MTPPSVTACSAVIGGASHRCRQLQQTEIPSSPRFLGRYLLISSRYPGQSEGALRRVSSSRLTMRAMMICVPHTNRQRVSGGTLPGGSEGARVGPG